MILYHGTVKSAGKKIEKEGLKAGMKPNWAVPSRQEFVYLSLAYAPFYAASHRKDENYGALVKVEVADDKLYPEDDFIMYALGKSIYKAEDINAVNFKQLKSYYKESLQHLGNACAKPQDIKVLGVTYFNMKKLILVCDPVIVPLNYKLMGEYYRGLTEWIYEGNKPEDFNRNPDYLTKALGLLETPPKEEKL